MKFGLRELLFVALLLGIPVGAYFFIFKPHNQQKKKLYEAIQAKQAKLLALQKATAHIKNLQEEIDKLQRAIKFFEDKLPQRHEVDAVLKQVWQIAYTNNLTTKSVRTLKNKPCAHYYEQPIKMVFEGDFNGFYKFLIDLEKLPRITRIYQMCLKKKKGEEGVTEATIVLSIYFEQPNALGSGKS